LSGPIGPTGSELEPVEEEETDPAETSSDGAVFSACEGLTGLDNAICRHEALLVVHPDNRGLRYSLGHLQENKANHEGSAGEGHSGDDPSEDGSTGGSSSGHGQSGESHGNGGGNGHANAGGNGKGNGNGNANGH
jgi:hypothetical protein